MSRPPPFAVTDLHRYANRDSALRQPQEITSFSFDDEHIYRPDTSSLRWYYNPELGISLSDGFKEFDKHDDSVDEHLDGLLKALTELEQKTGERSKADIVTWRGMMTKVMSLPFDMRNSWEMNVVKFQGTHYIEENHAHKLASRAAEGTADEMRDVMSFWGYKFESLATLPAPWDDCSRDTIQARTSARTSNKPQFCSIVRTAVTTPTAVTHLILGGEVDAIWDSHPSTLPSRPHYVELKTSKLPTNDRDDIAFERKLMRIWAQSFLLGVKTVVVGFRDREGRLVSVKEYETEKLPGLAKRSGRELWDGRFAVDFWECWCEWLRECVKEEGVVYRIAFKKNGREVECWPVEGESFLEKGFVEWREELARREAEKAQEKPEGQMEEVEEEEAGRAASKGEENTQETAEQPGEQTREEQQKDQLKQIVTEHRKREAEVEPFTPNKKVDTEEETSS